MVSIPEFWRLAMESRLFSTQQLESLRAEYAQVKGASDQGNIKTLTEWLVARGALSRYQAKILSGGRSGPFYYGDYKVYDRLEAGRWAGLFRAAHVLNGHPVLLEFLTGPLTQDARLWSDTRARVAAYSQVKHPYVARIHELVDLVSFKFLAREDPRGQSLAEYLAGAGGKRPGANESCRLVREAALALAELHGRRLVHGDLRPGQLWLTEDVHLKVLLDPLSPPGPFRPEVAAGDARMMARADYLAPELSRPDRLPDRLSDIYALGCVFYELLSGRPPFAGGDPSSKLERHARQPIEPLEPRGVPQPIAQVVAYMMAKNPSVRYQQAGIVAEQLEAFIDPARLPLRPHQPGSLAAYEAAMERKAGAAGQQPPAASGAAAASSPSASHSAPPAPVIAVTGSPTPVPAGAQTTRAAGPALEIVGGGPPVSASPRTAKSSRKQHSPLRIAAWLGGAGAVLIVLLLIFNSLGGSGSSGDTETAEGTGVAEATTGTRDSGSAGTGGASGPAGEQLASPTAAGNPAGTPRPAPGGEVPLAGTQPAESPEPAGSAADEVRRVAVVPDDGKLLWASPTAGPPIRLNYFPPGGQIFLQARPAEMLASEQARLVLEALGPRFQNTRSAWESAAGVPLEQVERLLIGFYDDGEQLPRPFHAVWLAESAERQALLSGWGNPVEVREGNAVYYRGPGHSYWIPDEADAPSFLMGAEAEIQVSAQLQGAIPPLRRGMGPLLASSDTQRHFTLLAAPSYLSTSVLRDGRDFYFGAPRPLRTSLEWLLGDDLQAVLVSMHFEDPSYWEMRLYSSLNRDYHTLAGDMRDRIAEIPAAVERHIVGLNPHPYWRMVAFRYPAMVRFLHEHTRIGAEDDQAVINGMLPGVAAHNLVFGGEMLLGAGSAAPVAVAAAPKSGPRTIEEVLDLKMDLMFDQTSLEFSMRDLAADIQETHSPQFDFGITILGDDLKLEGITRNQQIRDFNQQGKTVAEILTALVMKANPVTTVQSPSEDDQKLVWVVGQDPDNPSRKIVLITTRSAAEAKNYTLPAPFRPQA